MIAHEERATGYRKGFCKFPGNDGTRARLQSRRQMFFIVDENQIVGRRRSDARHSVDYDFGVPDQAGSDRLGDVLQRALHGSHCIAAGRGEGRAVELDGENERKRRLRSFRVHRVRLS